MPTQQDEKANKLLAFLPSFVDKHSIDLCASSLFLRNFSSFCSKTSTLAFSFATRLYNYPCETRFGEGSA